MIQVTAKSRLQPVVHPECRHSPQRLPSASASVLTQQEVLGIFQRRAADYDRWFAAIGKVTEGAARRWLPEGQGLILRRRAACCRRSKASPQYRAISSGSGTEARLARSPKSMCPSHDNVVTFRPGGSAIIEIG